MKEFHRRAATDGDGDESNMYAHRLYQIKLEAVESHFHAIVLNQV